MQSVYFCNLKRELGCILACVGIIGEEIINKCHPEFISGSYQRRVVTTNVNPSLLPMQWEKMSERQMRVKYVQEPSPIFYALSSSCKKSPLPQVGEGNEKVGVECQ